MKKTISIILACVALLLSCTKGADQLLQQKSKYSDSRTGSLSLTKDSVVAVPIETLSGTGNNDWYSYHGVLR